MEHELGSEAEHRKHGSSKNVSAASDIVSESGELAAFPHLSPETLVRLQRTIGNQGVLRLLRRTAEAKKTVQPASPKPSPQTILELQRTVGNQGVLRLLRQTEEAEEQTQQPSEAVSEISPHDAHVVRRGRTRIKSNKPKYVIINGKRVRMPKRLGYNPNPRRGPTTRAHTRHVIPHSDLQMWMVHARRPDAVGQTIRNVLVQLCGLFGGTGQNFATLLQGNWATNYGLHEAGLWQFMEWNPYNTFRGNGAINMAIQNRFDAGGGHHATLFPLWTTACTALGLNPTAVQNVQLSVFEMRRPGVGKKRKLPMTVQVASHNQSRALHPVFLRFY